MEMKKRTDWFFTMYAKPVNENKWGFWKEHSVLKPRDNGSTVTIINFGWKNFGFFYFKETI